MTDIEFQSLIQLKKIFAKKNCNISTYGIQGVI